MRLLAAIGAALVLIAGAGAAAHELYFERCGACHGPAGQLSRSDLVLEDGVLRTRRANADLREFLRDHGGDLTPAEIETVYAELDRVARRMGRFQKKCGLCHPSAKTLAQRKLVIRDGVLIGRYSGRDMETFLARHGRVAEDEVRFFVDVLTRVGLAYRSD